MIGAPLGWVYGHVMEWGIHRYLLHGAAKKRGHPFSFHFHEHHRNSRSNRFQDPIYERSVFHWNGAGKEALALGIVTVAHLPLVTVAPWFTAAVVASSLSYHRVHKRSHQEPEWAKEHLPWHFDHHMAPNQDANFGVRRDWVDRLMGTRVPYLGTEKAARDEARRAAREAAKAA